MTDYNSIDTFGPAPLLAQWCSWRAHNLCPNHSLQFHGGKMMHGPDRLGKPHILPLCLKEGSTERSHKKNSHLPFPSATEWGTYKALNPIKTEQRVDECPYQKLTILWTSGHSQCKPKPLVASERDCRLGVFSLNHVNRAWIFNVFFSIVWGKEIHKHLALYDKYSSTTDERNLSKEWERDFWLIQ